MSQQTEEMNVLRKKVDKKKDKSVNQKKIIAEYEQQTIKTNEEKQMMEKKLLQAKLKIENAQTEQEKEKQMTEKKLLQAKLKLENAQSE